MWYYANRTNSSETISDFQLFGLGLHKIQPPVVRMDGHPRDQFLYSSSGEGVLILNQTKIKIPEKSGIFLPAHIPHEYYPTTPIWDIRWMVPGGTSLKELYQQVGLYCGVFPLKNHTELDFIINKMHHELIHDKEFGELFASKYVSLFILEFARQAGLLRAKISMDSKEISKNAKRLEIINDYIQYNYMYPIKLEDLCTLVKLTPQHLCRVLKEETNMRPMEYVNTVRIDAAKTLLINSTHSIQNISSWCGFENENYFWRTFRKQTGMTPGAFRKEYTML